ncbi:hypothetical protein [Cellulomonas sp. SLBN-39]|uniref:hypothetical protein n=1 Tax=Cellulomonas sp. SLBN-39 TaxID=2768446 RepID=UPI001172608E|nr:hypothetical protein [Cellulomonas sp. SLBN-39]TQL02955.1 hypothetical protein FBY24_2043 [Cellulomonas sp. SLBN-39]
MKTLVVVLLLAWLALSVLGAIIEGLLWLTAIGALLLVATAVYGWFKLRSATTSSTQA